MNKIIIKIFTIFLMLGLISCSYKPIFLEENYNFKINEIILIGEKNINRAIKNKLSLIKDTEDNDKIIFNIRINSLLKKETISSNSKGDPVKFEMIVLVKYELRENGKLVLDREIQKSNIYDNESDKFKLEQNERIILENLAEKISDIIITSIINLNDN